MTKTLTLLTAAVALIGLSACHTAPRATDLPPGKYESTSKSVNSAGTKTVTKKTTEVEADEYGNKKATVESEKTTDPKGWFNKSTSNKKTVVKEQH